MKSLFLLVLTHKNHLFFERRDCCAVKHIFLYDPENFAFVYEVRLLNNQTEAIKYLTERIIYEQCHFLPREKTHKLWDASHLISG